MFILFQGNQTRSCGLDAVFPFMEVYLCNVASRCGTGISGILPPLAFSGYCSKGTRILLSRRLAYENYL